MNTRIFAPLLFTSLSTACTGYFDVDVNPSDSSDAPCLDGMEGCLCFANDSCDIGLQCIDAICVGGGGAYCGDWIVDPGEVCDGPDTQGLMCEDYGYGPGEVQCQPDCTVDLSACEGGMSGVCGNGLRDPGEACDGGDFGGMTCQELGWPEGQLVCTPDCQIDESMCSDGGDPGAMCGNGMLDPGEQCDGSDTAGMMCEDFGYMGGFLQCDPMCNFDFIDCGDPDPDPDPGDPLCGNDVIDPGEMCDGLLFGDEGMFPIQEAGDLSQCWTYGYDEGTVTCDPFNCWTDTGACVYNDCDAPDVMCGTFNVSSQAELDSLNGIRVIRGSLHVEVATATNLSALSSLEIVNGNFQLQNMISLASFDGLQALHSVRGLQITFAPVLTDASALNLEHVGSVNMGQILQLPDLSFLSGATNGTSVFLNQSPGLTSLDGLNSWEGLTTLQINDCDGLGDLVGLPASAPDLYYLELGGNGGLSSLNGMSFTSALGHVAINDNDGLLDLGGLNSVAGVLQNLSISANDALTDLSALSGVTAVQSQFSVSDNAALDTLGSWPLLASVGGFYVNNNAVLTTLGDFPALNSVEQSFYVNSNSSLASWGNFPQLLGIDGQLSVNYSGLSDFAGLGALASVQGELQVYGNPNLINFAGLDDLASIGGLSVDSNNSLLDFGGLGALVGILGGSFQINNNPELVDVTELHDVFYSGGNIYIDYNDVLLECSAENLVAAINGGNYTGSATTAPNKSGGNCP